VLATPDVADLKLDLQGVKDRLFSAAENQLDVRRARLDGVLARLGRASPAWRVRNDRQRLDDLQARLERAGLSGLRLRRARQEALTAHLTALSPLAVLQRGYALVQTTDGRVVRQAAQLAVGQEIEVRLVDGRVSAAVTGITE
jgi:exodeoxyribonuclease VII large subunit